MTGRALLYGATGYTGRLVAERLAARGVDLVLAGRNAGRVQAIATALGLEWRVFGLETMAVIAASLADINVVLHAAGPFRETAEPMMAACLASGTHYLDLAGEWPVFQNAADLGPAACAAGLMLLPGVGLTVAATDCLLALALLRQPDTVKLRLGVSWPAVISRGTMVSAADLLGPDVVIRRGGQLQSVPAGTMMHAFDFGAGLRDATVFSWADVVTGEHTTGVRDIEVYTQVDWPQRLSYRVAGVGMAVSGANLWRTAGAAMAKVWPSGPTRAARDRAGFVMVAEAIDPWRRVTTLRMQTLDGYTASVITAAAAVERVLAGTWAPGFQTPARVFGADFILGLGCAALIDPAACDVGDAA